MPRYCLHCFVFSRLYNPRSTCMRRGGLHSRDRMGWLWAVFSHPTRVVVCFFRVVKLRVQLSLDQRRPCDRRVLGVAPIVLRPPFFAVTARGAGVVPPRYKQLEWFDCIAYYYEVAENGLQDPLTRPTSDHGMEFTSLCDWISHSAGGSSLV